MRLAGLAQLAGAMGVALGVLGSLAALGLGLFVLVAAFAMHPFWRFEGTERLMQQSHFMKNIGLVGAAILTFALFSSVGGHRFVIFEPWIQF